MRTRFDAEAKGLLRLTWITMRAPSRGTVGDAIPLWKSPSTDSGVTAHRSHAAFPAILVFAVERSANFPELSYD
jgi:hypothetical protein